MTAVVAGKEIVFHVAAWLSTRTDGEEQARRLNADAVRELIEISAEANVKRFVLVSTIAAYGPPQKICMDEFTPVDVNQPDNYGRTKRLTPASADNSTNSRTASALSRFDISSASVRVESHAAT